MKDYQIKILAAWFLWTFNNSTDPIYRHYDHTFCMVCKAVFRCVGAMNHLTPRPCGQMTSLSPERETWLVPQTGDFSLIVLSTKIEVNVHSIFASWVVTSVITSFGVNIEWIDRNSTRWVVIFHSMTGVRNEWNSLLNEWKLFTP